MKTKTIIIIINILLIINTGILFGQKTTSSEVTPDDGENPRKEIIKEKIYKLENEYRSLEKSLNISSPIGIRYFDDNNDKASVERILKSSRKVLKKIEMNPKLFSLANEIDLLEAKLNINNGEHDSFLKHQKKIAQENIRRGNEHLGKLNKIKIAAFNKEEGSKKQHNLTMAALDNEIFGVKKQLINEKTKLEAYKRKNKTKSIDDFLSKNHKTKTTNNNDFLAESKTNSSNTNDFLAEKNTKSNDFLSESGGKSDFLGKEDKSSFKINYKNGKYGVINENGKILIPYRNWRIEEYKGGIASVYIEISSSPNYRYGTQSASATAFKFGYVDISGKFLDGYTITFSEHYIDTYMPGLTLVSNNAPKLSDSEIRRRKKAFQRRRELNEEKLENDLTSWKNSIINKYQ